MLFIEHKGFNVSIMRAERLIGDYVHELPPGRRIEVYPVDAFEKPLDNWIKGAGNYVVPVEAEWGLWFDWRGNDVLNTAVLTSIKGMNPITGQRSNGFSLERYEENCPIHKTKFKDGLFCEACNFKWPHQNYVAYPNVLWWDGFRTADGKVRQFFFTEDLLRSVPEQVIGKEDTVPAFGFAFFRTKVRREQQIKNERLSHKSFSYNYNNELCKENDLKCYNSTGTKYLGSISTTKSKKISKSLNQNVFHFSSSSDFSQCSDGDITLSHLNETKSCGAIPCAASAVTDDLISGKSLCNDSFDMEQINDANAERCRCLEQKPVAEVGVGAGAEIEQKLNVDPLKVTDWENEPASVMRLYFIFVNEFKQIADKGIRDLTGTKNGFMEGIKVG